MRYQQQLFRTGPLAITSQVLRPNSETPGALLDLRRLVSALAAPVGVTKVDPQAARLTQNRTAGLEDLHQRVNELLGVRLQSDLSVNSVVPLPIERR